MAKLALLVLGLCVLAILPSHALNDALLLEDGAFDNLIINTRQDARYRIALGSMGRAVGHPHHRHHTHRSSNRRALRAAHKLGVGGQHSNSIRRQLAGNHTDPPVCTWDITGTPYFGGCRVNVDWISMQKPVSSRAKYDVMVAAYEKVCNSHPVSNMTAEQYEACNADEAHSCSVGLDFLTGAVGCHTNAGATLWPSMIKGCEGSLYSDIRSCWARNRTSCESPDNSTCVWFEKEITSTLWPPGAYDMFNNVTLGYGDKYGFCESTRQDLSSGMAWYMWQQKYMDPKTPEAIIDLYGNCSYGLQNVYTTLYKQGCEAFNYNQSVYLPEVNQNATAVMGLQMTGLNITFDGVLYFLGFTNVSSINATRLSGCTLSSCGVTVVPGSTKLFNEYNDVPMAYCEADFVSTLTMQYGDAGDRDLLDAWRLCSADSVRWDAKACAAAEWPYATHQHA